MATKPLLPNVEIDDYAQRMKVFMRKLTDAYQAAERVGELRWNPVRNRFNEILRRAGALKGELHTQSLTAFYQGKVDKQVYPYTLLRLAVLAQHYQNHFPPADRGTWGSTFEEGLNRMCDELAYGRPAPKGVPADRWHPDFSAAKVAAEYGLKQPEGNGGNAVVGFTQLLNQMADLSLAELEQVGQTVLGILHARAQAVAAEFEDEEPELLLCDQYCQLAVLMGRQRRVTVPLSEDVIQAIADDARMSLERMQRLLCGDAPKDNEIDQLSVPARMSPDELRRLLVEARAPQPG